MLWQKVFDGDSIMTTRSALTMCSFVLISMMSSAPAHANTLEELLRSTIFKNVLQKQADIPTLLKQCQDARFRAANVQQCQSAEVADRVNRAPPELRSVLASDRGTASLRELCLGANQAVASTNYLCIEYAKLDAAFRSQLSAVQNRPSDNSDKP
jgi:hypothetical protein